MINYPFLFSRPLFYSLQQQQHSVGWLSAVGCRLMLIRATMSGAVVESKHISFRQPLNLCMKQKSSVFGVHILILGSGECWGLILSRGSRWLWWRPSLHQGSSEVSLKRVHLWIIQCVPLTLGWFCFTRPTNTEREASMSGPPAVQTSSTWFQISRVSTVAVCSFFVLFL